MPTDEERREVARSLRLLGDDLREGRRNRIRLDDIRRVVFGHECPSLITDRLADLIEPHRGSGERSILCAHCENASWCGCEPGDEDGGCDFEPSVTEGEPPYNLYTLYEAVFHRSPRCWECIEDDEVDELVDALLDICNVPGHDLIKACDASQSRRDTVSSDPTERGIDSIYNWCFAAIEGADGAEDELYCSIMRAIEDYRHPERATAHTVRTGDRDALLALADEMTVEKGDIWRWSSRIREALGEGS